MRFTTLPAAAFLAYFAIAAEMQSGAAADPAPPPPPQMGQPAPPPPPPPPPPPKMDSQSKSLPEQMRAYSIGVSPAFGIVPGDHVDIIFAHNIAQDVKANEHGSDMLHESLRPAVSEVLLSDVTVLGAMPGAIMVQVTPVQVQQLSLAQRLGTLSAAVRSDKDAGKKDMPAATTLDNLANLQGVQAQKKEEPVKIVRGRMSTDN